MSIDCPHGAVDSIFCTPCCEARDARIAANLAKDRAYLKAWNLRNAGILAAMPSADECYRREHPDRLPPPNRENS